jgi:hypothetical protein
VFVGSSRGGAEKAAGERSWYLTAKLATTSSPTVTEVTEIRGRGHRAIADAVPAFAG